MHMHMLTHVQHVVHFPGGTDTIIHVFPPVLQDATRSGRPTRTNDLRSRHRRPVPLCLRQFHRRYPSSHLQPLPPPPAPPPPPLLPPPPAPPAPPPPQLYGWASLRKLDAFGRQILFFRGACRCRCRWPAIWCWPCLHPAPRQPCVGRRMTCHAYHQAGPSMSTGAQTANKLQQ